MPDEPFLTFIAGVPHRKPDLSKLSVGDTVILEPEPTNRFDPGAIKVLHHGVHLGYIPRIDNARPEVKGQASAHIVKIEPATKWQEVTISIP